MDEFHLNWSNDAIKPPIVVEARDRVTDVCSLNLYGKGAVKYGEGLQENLLRLMENFCSNVAPPFPTKGQLWFDTSADTLQVYNGASWTPISGLGSGTVSTQPAGDNDASVATTAFVQTAIAGRITKNVSNTPLVALTQVEAGNGIIEFSGALDATTNVIVPNGVSKKWLVLNSTSGAHDLIVKTLSGTGVTIPKNKTLFIYSDTVNVRTVDVDVLSQVLASGGAGSGLDADLLDGQQGSFYAPVTSPALQGTPTAPTATTGTNNTQIATTAFVETAIQNSTSSVSLGTDAADIKMDGTVSVGTKNTAAKSDHIHPTDTSRAPLASPAFTGVPTAPTATSGTNTAQLATTAFVAAAVSGLTGGGGGPTLSFETTSSNIKADGVASAGTLGTVPRADHIHPTDSTRAPVNSPNFTGTPTGPTATAGTNTTQLATTAFVANAVNVSLNLNNTAALITTNGIQSAGTSSSVARADHVHPTDTTRAPLNSPTFTGTPTAPTAPTGTSTTQIATTAFVASAVSGGGGGGAGLNSTNSVITMNGIQSAGTATTAARADHVHPQDTSRASLIDANTFTNANTFNSNTPSVFKMPPTITNPATSIYTSSNNQVATVGNAYTVASGNASLGSTGFKTWPAPGGNFIMQWAQVTITSNTAGTFSKVLPMSFPNNVVAFSVTPGFNVTLSWYGFNNTGVQFNYPANCLNMAVLIMVIGY